MKTRKTAAAFLAVLIVAAMLSIPAYADWFKVFPGQTIYHPIGDVVEGSYIANITGLPDGVWAEIIGDEVVLQGAATTPGTYNVEVQCDAGQIFYSEILVETLLPDPTIQPVRQPPYITFQSRGQNLFVGDSGSVSVEVENPGGYELYYSWSRNGAAIYGASSPTYYVDTSRPAYDNYVCTIYYYVNGVQNSIASNPIPVEVAQKQKTITGIGISTCPTRIEYCIGDYLNTNGLSIRVYYSDGSSSTEWNGFSCNPCYFDRAGAHNITVNYSGYSASFRVTVKEKASVKNISVSRLPYKTVYTVNEKLEPAGLALNLVYSDGSSLILTNGFSCSPITFTIPGRQTITVSYGGKSCSFDVTVNKAGTQPSPTVSPSSSPLPSASPLPSPTPSPSEKDRAGSMNYVLLGIIFLLLAAVAALAAILIKLKMKQNAMQPEEQPQPKEQSQERIYPNDYRK